MGGGFGAPSPTNASGMHAAELESFDLVLKPGPPSDLAGRGTRSFAYQAILQLTELYDVTSVRLPNLMGDFCRRAAR